LNDAQLTARCRRGDPQAWPDLVRRFAPYVHAIARAHGLQEHDAEDVFQEVFVRTWQNLDRLRTDEAIRPWIGQLTRRLAVDRIRVLSRTRARANLDDVASLPSDDALVALDDAITVRVAMSRLPALQQEILRRVYVDDQSHATIAAALGIAEGTVASRASRARHRLRSLLGSEWRAITRATRPRVPSVEN
jgi:RNA polymerase sigma-70 factor (ECF subfamily)